jgi:hypothetical protein
MKFREVLAILKEMEEKQPDILNQTVSVMTDEVLEVQLTLTLGATQEIYFIPAYSGSEYG